jgi:hypothetical protein
MRVRVFTVLTVVGLVAFAGSAHAECAWVLWLERTSAADGARRWHAINAASTVSECDANLAATITLQSKGASGEIVELKGDMIIRTNARGSSFLRYVCLPDTTDPRVPKTK